MATVPPAHAPVAEQAAAFTEIVLANPTVSAVLDRLPLLEVPDCWLAAGALFQTVWNHLSGRDLRAGIRDYDVNYFDATDLSWEAEDRVITRAAKVFADVPATVEVRNEARVHVWYEQRYGVPCLRYRRTADAIATFPNTSSCFAIRCTASGAVEVLAPFGFTDLFSMRARPNPVLAPREVYEAKTKRWQSEWQSLTVLPWP